MFFFFKIEKISKGDVFCSNVPIEILGDSTLKIIEDVYDISTNHQNVFTSTTEKPLKQLNALDRLTYQNIL